MIAQVHVGFPYDPPRIGFHEGLRDGAWEPTDEVMGPGDRAWVAIENHPQFADVVADLEPPPPHGHPDETHLDMNALIDVCLVLLSFFILTTTYANRVQKVVPIPMDKGDGPKAKALTVADIKSRMIRVTAVEKAGKPEVLICTSLAN